jgi:hypothetical protein
MSGLTTRWSGPGMRRQMQENVEGRAAGKRIDGAFPGRSARSRWAAK